MASKCVHFATVCMDPTNFRIKILEISTLGAKCYLNVARSAPDMKITTFCKVLPERLFMHFLRVLIEDFAFEVCGAAFPGMPRWPPEFVPCLLGVQGSSMANFTFE